MNIYFISPASQTLWKCFNYIYLFHVYVCVSELVLSSHSVHPRDQTQDTPGIKLRTPGLGASTLPTEFALPELFALWFKWLL